MAARRPAHQIINRNTAWSLCCTPELKLMHCIWKTEGGIWRKGRRQRERRGGDRILRF